MRLRDVIILCVLQIVCFNAQSQNVSADSSMGYVDSYEYYNHMKNARLHTITKYMDGRLHGCSKEFYENGSLRTKVCFNKGVIADDTIIIYLKSGEISAKLPLKDGKIEGVVVTYSRKGTVEKKISYKNGALDGMSEIYHKSKLIAKSEFHDGKKHGQYIFYAGKIKIIETAQNGMLTSNRLYINGDNLESKDLLDETNQNYIATYRVDKKGNDVLVTKYKVPYPSSYDIFVGIPLPKILESQLTMKK